MKTTQCSYPGQILSFVNSLWDVWFHSGENKKPFTCDNHHGLLQYKNGLLRQNLVNWSTTINSGHFPADQEQKLANSGQNKQNLVYITKKMVCLTNMILASRAIWRMGEYPLGLHKDSHGFIYTPGSKGSPEVTLREPRGSPEGTPQGSSKVALREPPR